MKAYTLGFIGGGNMAGSLIGGLVPGTLLPEDVVVGEPDTNRRGKLEDQYGVRVADDNRDVVDTADVVIIAVKPQLISSVLPPLSDLFAARNRLIISIAAGVRIQAITALLGQEYPIVRVMPNTPALVGRGASGMYAGPLVSEAQRELADVLLGATGITVWVNSESDIDTVTALSGSGPAYFLLFIQALTDAAAAAGLDPKSAEQLATATAAGAAELAVQSDEEIGELIRRVTSPGGTTEQALKSLAENNFSQVVGDAFEAARIRSEQLAAGFEVSDTEPS